MFVMTLPAPPSANKMYRYAGNRVLKSSAYRQWLKECDALIWQKGWRDQMTGPLRVRIHITPKDNRLRDIDNYIKPCLDVLESAGVIENDRLVVTLEVERFSPRGGHPHTVQILADAITPDPADTRSDRP